MPEGWDELEECLRRHDWYYNYTDCSATWKVGEAHWQRIVLLLETLGDIDRPRVCGLVQRYAPEGFYLRNEWK